MRTRSSGRLLTRLVLRHDRSVDVIGHHLQIVGQTETGSSRRPIVLAMRAYAGFITQVNSGLLDLVNREGFNGCLDQHKRQLGLRRPTISSTTSACLILPTQRIHNSRQILTLSRNLAGHTGLLQHVRQL